MNFENPNPLEGLVYLAFLWMITVITGAILRIKDKKESDRRTSRPPTQSNCPLDSVTIQPTEGEWYRDSLSEPMIELDKKLRKLERTVAIMDTALTIAVVAIYAILLWLY